jgi:hypothetical protein
MLYPIWQRLPRPPYFPGSPELDRLLDGYNPNGDYFKLLLWRREARDLRKGLFGPKGLKTVPKSDGVQRFQLPNGWMLRLTYYATHWAGQVTAEFIPPTMRDEPPIPSRWVQGAAAQAQA